MRPAQLLDRLAAIGATFAPTPVRRLEHDRLDLYAKFEFNNPSGSIKDRSAYRILLRAVERGAITDRTTLVESSSGNFAVSLASFCNALGIAYVPVVDPNINPATERFLRAACERVEKVSTPDDRGGYLRTRIQLASELASEEATYRPDQYANRDAAEAHRLTTGAEIARAFDRLDYVFVGVGTGATIAGISARLREDMPRVRIIAVDAEGSAIFGDRPRARRIPGIGSSIRPPLLDLASIDDVVIVPERDAVRGCQALLRRHGIFAGGSTGSAYAAISRYFLHHTGPRPRVLFLCADRGTGYAETVYRPGWLDSPDAVPVEAPQNAIHGSTAVR